MFVAFFFLISRCCRSFVSSHKCEFLLVWCLRRMGWFGEGIFNILPMDVTASEASAGATNVKSVEMDRKIAQCSRKEFLIKSTLSFCSSYFCFCLLKWTIAVYKQFRHFSTVFDPRRRRCVRRATNSGECGRVQCA